MIAYSEPPKNAADLLERATGNNQPAAECLESAFVGFVFNYWVLDYMPKKKDFAFVEALLHCRTTRTWMTTQQNEQTSMSESNSIKDETSVCSLELLLVDHDFQDCGFGGKPRTTW